MKEEEFAVKTFTRVKELFRRASFRSDAFFHVRVVSLRQIELDIKLYHTVYPTGYKDTMSAKHTRNEVL